MVISRGRFLKAMAMFKFSLKDNQVVHLYKQLMTTFKQIDNETFPYESRTHYENLPMQYTETFKSVKNENFQ